MNKSHDRSLDVIGRSQSLFHEDIERHERTLAQIVRESRFLVIGGGGSIGQAVSLEIFSRGPRALHVVDLSENNLVELVRDIRSTMEYGKGEFLALPLDSASCEYDAFIRSQPPYDYILNLAALKHVRSEKDPYTLMRMVMVNIINTEALARQAMKGGCRRFFSVSTDKAVNPASMMGASKRIMELFLIRASMDVPVGLARFANVAFSDGSLLHGFRMRMEKRQPIAAPRDVQRYFISENESGELCLLSSLLGGNRELFFPKLTATLHLQSFDVIARAFLAAKGYEALACENEAEARERADELIPQKKWPCWFFDSDTTGEKEIEEFYTADEHPDLGRYASIGVLSMPPDAPAEGLERFVKAVRVMRERGNWTKRELVEAFTDVLPGFAHEERNRYLDGRM